MIYIIEVKETGIDMQIFILLKCFPMKINGVKSISRLEPLSLQYMNAKRSSLDCETPQRQSEDCSSVSTSTGGVGSVAASHGWVGGTSGWW